MSLMSFRVLKRDVQIHDNSSCKCLKKIIRKKTRSTIIFIYLYICKLCEVDFLHQMKYEGFCYTTNACVNAGRSIIFGKGTKLNVQAGKLYCFVDKNGLGVFWKRKLFNVIWLSIWSIWWKHSKFLYWGHSLCEWYQADIWKRDPS